jgi:polyphosphate kinase 2
VHILSDYAGKLPSFALKGNTMAKKKKRSEKKKAEKTAKQADDKNTNLSRKEYDAELYKLHAELVKLQYWVIEKRLRIIVVFEGRDAAGKGGFIKRITERVNPRVFRVAALPAPSEREKTQVYIQRYLAHFPAAGEVVLFDRSWYNRAGVERVMGFCTKSEYERFLHYVPMFEKMIVDAGILLIKYWFNVSMEEQEQRFRERMGDPRKTWKFSPMDIESYNRWYDYSRSRDDMFAATDLDYAPWYIVQADDKRRARLNCISHFLHQIPYKKLSRKSLHLGKRNMKGNYDDQASLKGKRFVPERF